MRIPSGDSIYKALSVGLLTFILNFTAQTSAKIGGIEEKLDRRATWMAEVNEWRRDIDGWRWQVSLKLNMIKDEVSEKEKN